jgi:hypothetical protein
MAEDVARMQEQQAYQRRHQARQRQQASRLPPGSYWSDLHQCYLCPAPKRRQRPSDGETILGLLALALQGQAGAGRVRRATCAHGLV